MAETEGSGAMADQKKGTEIETMSPWEQHSSIINLPRFDYNAPSSLLHRSHSGFLITCTIKREKSATKEVMNILEKHAGSKMAEAGHVESSESSDAEAEAKRRRLCAEEANKGDGNLGNSKANSEADYALVKLTRSGLLLLLFHEESSPDVVNIVSDIFAAISSRSLKSTEWCHRIFPIQATCCLNEKELKSVVLKLVPQFLDKNKIKLVSQIKFAVGFNSRGFNGIERKTSKDGTKNYDQLALLDRDKCFTVVAGAVKEVVPESSVDLKSPEFAVLVELLPVSGVPNDCLIVAVSVLPKDLLSTKPRLCVKPLAPQGKKDK